MHYSEIMHTFRHPTQEIKATVMHDSVTMNPFGHHTQEIKASAMRNGGIIHTF